MGVVLWLTEPGRLGKATSGGTFVWKAALMVMVEPSGPVGSDSLGSQPQGSSCPFCCKGQELWQLAAGASAEGFAGRGGFLVRVPEGFCGWALIVCGGCGWKFREVDECRGGEPARVGWNFAQPGRVGGGSGVWGGQSELGGTSDEICRVAGEGRVPIEVGSAGLNEYAHEAFGGASPEGEGFVAAFVPVGFCGFALLSPCFVLA